MKKINPKKDKSARRKRNPLHIVGSAIHGRTGSLYVRRIQCLKCSLRSAIPGETFCASCR